jgi:Family of unknown function (DUF6056)
MMVGIPLGLLAFGFTALSLAVPDMADDGSRRNATTLGQAATSTIDEYHRWGGRFGATFSTYFLLGQGRIGEIAIAIIGALALVALILGAFIWFCDRAPTNEFDAIAICVLSAAVWFLPQGLGEAALWRTGSIQYLWPTTFAVWISLALRRGLRSTDPSIPNGAWVVLSIGAAITANWFEIIGIGFGAVFGFAAVKNLRQSRTSKSTARWPIGAYAMVAAWAIGVVVNVTAPGNSLRQTVEGRPPLASGILTMAVQIVMTNVLRFGPYIVGTLILGRWLDRSGFTERINRIVPILAIGVAMEMSFAFAKPVPLMARFSFIPDVAFAIATVGLLPIGKPLSLTTNSLRRFATIGVACMSPIVLVGVDMNTALSFYQSATQIGNERVLDTVRYQGRWDLSMRLYGPLPKPQRKGRFSDGSRFLTK